MSDVIVQTSPQSPANKPMHPKKKKLLKRGIAAAVAVAVIAGCGYGLRSFLTGEEGISEIYSQPAYIGSIQSKVSGSGTAMAKDSAAITLTQGGTVQEVFVTAGDVVMAGQPLYTIFSQAAQEAVDAAQKTVDDLNDELQDYYEDMANLTVRAPFAGKLQEVKHFEPDQNVSDGDPVAVLVNDRQLKLSLYFSYAYEDMIYEGQPVDVSVPAVMGIFRGEVENIYPVSFVSPEGGIHFEVEVVFDNPGTLTEGMDASASIAADDGSIMFPYDNAKLSFYETRTISAKTHGPVVEIGNLRNHANVSAGETLLILSSSTLDDDIRAKRKELEEADLKLQEALDDLADFNAVAPIDGTVTACRLTEGAEVKQGDTVIIISNNTTMLVSIQVDNTNVSFIKPGSFVDLDWNGMMYQGEVTSIDMAGAEIGSGMTRYPVTLSVDNYDGSLMDGAWLTYSFVTSESESCVLIPTSAVKYVSDMDGNRQAVVFVRREEAPEEIPELDLPKLEPGQKKPYPTQEEGYYPVIVETGISDAQNVEIVSGIAEGDEVFINYTVTDMGSNW